jgi:hypothetical protein
MENKDENRREELITLLNEEINLIEKESSRPGWTSWALFGAFATLIWLLTEYLENHVPNWKIVTIYIICFYFTFDLSKFFKKRFLDSIHSNDDRVKYFSNFFTESKSTIMISTLSYFFIGIYTYITSGEMNYFQYIFTIINCSFAIFASIIIFLLSKTSFAFPNNLHSVETISNKTVRKGSKTGLYLFFTILLITTYCWIVLAFNARYTVTNLKVSLLIFTCFFLLLLISSVKSVSSTLGNLIQLRRKLTFENLTNVEIENQLDLILRGVKTEEYYSLEASQLIAFVHSFEKEISQATRKIVTYENQRFKEGLKSEDIMISSLRDSVKQHLFAAAKIKFNHIDSLYKTLSRKVMFLKMYSGKSGGEILAQIDAKYGRLINDYNENVKLYFNLLKEDVGEKIATDILQDIMVTFPDLNFSLNDANPIALI